MSNSNAIELHVYGAVSVRCIALRCVSAIDWCGMKIIQRKCDIMGNVMVGKQVDMTNDSTRYKGNKRNPGVSGSVIALRCVIRNQKEK